MKALTEVMIAVVELFCLLFFSGVRESRKEESVLDILSLTLLAVVVFALMGEVWCMSLSAIFLSLSLSLSPPISPLFIFYRWMGLKFQRKILHIGTCVFEKYG